MKLTCGYRSTCPPYPLCKQFLLEYVEVFFPPLTDSATVFLNFYLVLTSTWLRNNSRHTEKNLRYSFKHPFIVTNNNRALFNGIIKHRKKNGKVDNGPAIERGKIDIRNILWNSYILVREERLQSNFVINFKPRRHKANVQELYIIFRNYVLIFKAIHIFHPQQILIIH